MHYSELKRNELSSHEKKWRNLKSVLPSKRSPSEKATYSYIHMNPTKWHAGKGRTIETVNRSSFLPEVAGGRMNRVRAKSNKTTLYDN